MADFVTQTPVVVGDATKASDVNTGIDNDDNLNARLSLQEGEGIPNGSFEFPIGGGLDAENWTATDTATGSHSVDTTTFTDGAQSFKAVVDAAGGFVTLINDTFSVVSGGSDDVFIRGKVYATAAARIRGSIKFYDDGLSLVATHTYLDTNTTALPSLNAWHVLRGHARAPAGARYWKPEFILGAGAVAADIFLDGLTSQLNDPYAYQYEGASGTLLFNNGPSYVDGTFTLSSPILGSAYELVVTNGTVGAGANFRFFGWDIDAAAWSSEPTLTQIKMINNILSTINQLDSTGRIMSAKCNQTGQMQVQMSGDDILDHEDIYLLGYR